MYEKLNEELINKIAELIAKEDKGKFEENTEKIRLMDLCCECLKNTTYGATITSVVGAPFKSMGCISLEGDDIVFDSPEALATVASAASNAEVYAKADGTVRVDFTFHGVAKKK